MGRRPETLGIVQSWIDRRASACQALWNRSVADQLNHAKSRCLELITNRVRCFSPSVSTITSRVPVSVFQPHARRPKESSLSDFDFRSAPRNPIPSTPCSTSLGTLANREFRLRSQEALGRSVCWASLLSSHHSKGTAMKTLRFLGLAICLAAGPLFVTSGREPPIRSRR